MAYTELAPQQEQRYTQFCERYDLDCLLDAYQQREELQTYGDSRLLRILDGIIEPKSAKQPSRAQRLIGSVINLVVRTEPKPARRISCADMDKQALSAARPTKSGQIQLGFQL